MRVARLASLAGALAMLACSSTSDSLTNPSGTGTTSMPSGATAVTIQDFSFTPSTVNIKVGTAVTWTNSGPSTHTTVSDDGMWNSGALNPPGGGGMYSSGSAAGTFQFTFSQAGTFRYHCSIHPPSMYPQFVGTVVVTP
jgi:plastocyanin